MTIFFYFDILTNFNTSYLDAAGELVENRGAIFKNYMKSWFIIDFISNIPLDMMLSGIIIKIKKNHKFQEFI